MRAADLDVTIADVARRPGVSELLRRLVLEHETMKEETDVAVVAEFPGIVERADVAVRHQLIDTTFSRVLHRLSGQPDPDADHSPHRAFGAAAAAAGLPLHELTAAYRLGSRVAWARLRRVANELDIDADTAMVLAQATLVCVDELTADSVLGYSQAIESAHHRRMRDHQGRLESLLEGSPTAALPGWGADDPLAVAVVLGDLGDLALPVDVLAGTYDGAAVVVGPAGGVTGALTGRDAVIGSGGTAAALPQSFRRARRLATLVTTGTITRSGLIRWDDELVTLVVHAAPEEAGALARRHLDPLRDPSPEREQWLLDTLAAWLEHPGAPQAVAERLRLHPQTVRYRLKRLRERLGDRIDDPAARVEMAIALGIRRCPTDP